MSLRAFLMILPVLLAACGGEEQQKDSRAERDPALARALADPIMADPDLAGQNRGNSVLQGGGPPSAEIPPFKTGPEEIEKARAAAVKLAGGELSLLPAPGAGLQSSRLAGRLTPQAMADALPELSQQCGRLEYGFVWAARLPASVPVYPRGHARQAAGSDAGGCRLRVVSFVTPVAARDVLAFYVTSAGEAGVALNYRKEGADEVLIGKRQGLGFAAFARPFDPGLTEVVLVTNER